jgi:hypothetical protein
VARVVARELGRDEAWVEREISAFTRRAQESLLG